MYRNLKKTRDIYKVYTNTPISIVKKVTIEKITNPWSGKELNVKKLNKKNTPIDSIIKNYFTSFN